jgi:uncharacterized membrane protein YoaK (UPF0700 family)
MLALTLATGLVDAVTFLGLGGVFVALMTGNLVFVGFALGGAPNMEVTKSLTAIASFSAGAVLGGRMGIHFAGAGLRRWVLAVALTESALLIAAGVVGLGFNIETRDVGLQPFAVIVLAAMAMGLRNATVSKMNVKDLKTTVMTLTLTSVGADSSLASGSNPNLGWRAASIIMMVIGAAFGALLLYRSGGVSLPLFVCGSGVLFVTLVYAALPAAQTARQETS